MHEEPGGSQPRVTLLQGCNQTMPRRRCQNTFKKVVLRVSASFFAHLASAWSCWSEMKNTSSAPHATAAWVTRQPRPTSPTKLPSEWWRHGSDTESSVPRVPLRKNNVRCSDPATARGSRRATATCNGPRRQFGLHPPTVPRIALHPMDLVAAQVPENAHSIVA
jgi:hypothetical protein